MSINPAAETARADDGTDRVLPRRARGWLLVLAVVAVIALSLGVAVTVNATVGIRVDTPAGR